MKKNKNTLIIILIIFFSLLVFFLFKNVFINKTEEDLREVKQPQAEEVNIQKLPDNHYFLNKGQSQFIWQASRLSPANYINKGTIEFKAGEFILNESKITAGYFIFDMASLKVIEMNIADSKIDLTNHLKSKDFLAVDDYPLAEIIIKEGVLSDKDDAGLLYEIKADLTIKGITQEIDFLAMLYTLNEKAKVDASLSIDRTLWNIRYGSANFFDLLADQTINDEVKIDINLVFVLPWID